MKGTEEEWSKMWEENQEKMEDKGKSVKKERVNKCQKPQRDNIRGRQKGI